MFQHIFRAFIRGHRNGQGQRKERTDEPNETLVLRRATVTLYLYKYMNITFNGWYW